jgi:hypothetical protein
LLKRYHFITLLVVLLAASSMVMAGTTTKMAFGTASASESDEATLVTMPLELSTSKEGLMAMDIPLTYSEGVTLKEVSFENTRVAHFDVKIANIDTENRQVIIGLISQISAKKVEPVSSGEGAIANLIFEVDDENVDKIELNTFETESPRHRLTFIYMDENGQDVEYPKIENSTMSLSGTTGDGSNLPKSFALNQNYPNPFNPTTTVSFTLPTATNYNLTIYNILGQVVEEFNGFDEGNVEIIWNASNNSSGVYFYKLTTDQNTATKKMVLLK